MLSSLLRTEWGGREGRQLPQARSAETKAQDDTEEERGILMMRPELLAHLSWFWLMVHPSYHKRGRCCEAPWTRKL
ncbi:hypothetical protein VSDG_06503 [Cytospora chrysosperma]|uniref:Uncharacterized protein n=1 Tax=Cytospora chrysosperma TaxID=252740 RepID=A0A423VLE3_CYTCH|nr:hypothetical protein VSDG_06503 [Valsa sordida]